MENVKQINKIKSVKSIYRKIFIKLLKRFNNGHLSIRLPEGEVIEIGENPGHRAFIHIKNEGFFKKAALYGDIGFGEAYIDGDWSTPDLTMLLRWAIGNVENTGFMSGSKVKNIGFNILNMTNKIEHFFNRNTKSGSQKNISYHYDLSNDFYQIMLDQTMSYSCGIFKEDESTLFDAQINKLKILCEDLDIQSGDHILEIGCGWGGFAEYAATHFDCKVTGITISKEQFEFAEKKIKNAYLEDKVTILLQDYRELKGKFNKIVSIEMIEAVGHDFLPQYFQTIQRLLKKNGVAVIQAITSPDSRYDSFRSGVDFIQKHIFPGSLLPSVGAMVTAYQNKTTLQLHNLRDIGLHYAKTLHCWRNKINENKTEITKIGMDEQFFRKWNYYLCYCEAAFIERNISTVQITLIKPNNKDYK